MRVTSIEMHPEGSNLSGIFSFRDPRRENKYNVKNIVGLDAEDIVPRFYGNAGLSEGFVRLYELALLSRNVVIRIELNPRFHLNESYSDLRDELYKMISTSRTGFNLLQFKDGETVVAVLSGFITKFEGSHFTKNPEVQITLECDEPMLKAPAPVEVSVVGLDPADTVIQDPVSTAPHGFQFEFDISGTIGSFGLNHRTSLPGAPETGFQIIPASGFLAGDVIQVSSEHNNKYVRLVRGGVTTEIADKIYPGTHWPILFPGDNEFDTINPESVSWKSITYTPTFWGV